MAYDKLRSRDPVLWGAVIVSLATGGTGSFYALQTRTEIGSQIDDRWRGSDAEKETKQIMAQIAIRDEQIKSCQRDITWLYNEFRQHRGTPSKPTHPPSSTEDRLQDYEQRIRKLEHDPR